MVSFFPGGAGKRGRNSIPILMYHEVSPRSHPALQKYVVSPQAFAAQMRWLARARYHPVTLTAVADALAGGRPLPSSPVVITFDDAYRDCVANATGVLIQYGFPASFFLVAGLVGESSRWFTARAGIELPLADWSMLRRLVTAGFECGSHSFTHLRLAELGDSACHEELFRSRQELEQRLGCAIVHLAYPYGSCDRRVSALAAATGYRTGCTVRPGMVSPAEDLLLLPRVAVEGTDSLPDFISRLATVRSLREHWSHFRQGGWRRRAVRDGAAA